jgi:hypothetical protein
MAQVGGKGSGSLKEAKVFRRLPLGYSITALDFPLLPLDFPAYMVSTQNSGGGMRWIAGLMLLVSSSAIGQGATQTPEGAQRFLSILAEQGALKIYYHYLLWPQFHLSYQVTSASSGGECVTRLEGVPDSIQFKGGLSSMVPSAGFDSDFRIFTRFYTHAPPPSAIDWSNVRSITITGPAAGATNDGLTLWITGGAGGSALYIGDAALTKRVHYALTFLKEHCDKTAETGF